MLSHTITVTTVLGGRRMRRIVSVILAVSMMLCWMPPVCSTASAEVSAQACILIEAATGRVLYEKQAYEKRPMASTTKIMAVLLTIESGDLDTEFVVDSDAIRVEGSSMGLQENDIVTKRALCYGMLLPSGNDAANAAAVAVAGSIPAFVERMNQRAAEIGMTRTCFVTPSGLDGEGHGASAYDMALLTRVALQNEVFREICCRPSALVTFGNPPYERTLYNSNKLLGMYEGVIGVKTGFTDEAGRCLVSACERDGVTLICVTLHAPDDWNDHMKLYDSCFSMVEAVDLEFPPILSQVLVGGEHERIALRPSETVTVGAEAGGIGTITCRVLLPPFAYAPVEAGDQLGVLEFYQDAICIAAVPLCAVENAAVKQQEQPSGNPFTRFRSWLDQKWK